MGRNEQTDAGRKGAASQTKQDAPQMPVRPCKGNWAPAYDDSAETHS